MILSIDFGGAVAKVLIVDPLEADSTFKIVEVPLGFRTRPRLTVPEVLRYVIRQAAGSKKPEAVYASGEIASVELKEILTQPPLDPVEAFKKLELPLVVVGAGITYVNGEANRGVEIKDCAEDIARWLPFGVKISEIQNYFANKRLYPQIVPATERDIRLEQAAARVRIRSTLNAQRSTINADYVIASGGVFSRAPTASAVVLMLLDSLEPQGLFKIYLDQKQLLPALATLAAFEEDNAQKILDQDPFVFLGATFSVSGSVSLQIDVGLSELQELEVPAGNLAVFPLDEGRTAKVKFQSPSERGEFEVNGGPAGLVIDARDRPLELPRGEGERIRALKDWEKAVCRRQLFKK